MSVETSIRTKLTEAFTPTQLVVENESAKHAGHAGVAHLEREAAAETHFRVVVVSKVFEGQSRVTRHRQVNEALKAELQGPVHALAIKALAPSEFTA